MLALAACSSGNSQPGPTTTTSTAAPSGPVSISITNTGPLVARTTQPDYNVVGKAPGVWFTHKVTLENPTDEPIDFHAGNPRNYLGDNQLVVSDGCGISGPPDPAVSSEGQICVGSGRLGPIAPGQTVHFGTIEVARGLERMKPLTPDGYVFKRDLGPVHRSAQPSGQVQEVTALDITYTVSPEPTR